MAKASTRPAPIVAVINMKGGVGKTVLSGNVFRELFATKRLRTLLVDFDAQFNLSQLLLTYPEYDALQNTGKTIFHVLESPPPESVFAISEDDMSDVGDVDRFTEQLDHDTADATIDLRLLPGDFNLAILNIRERPALRLPRARFRSFIEKAKVAYDLVVLDCNPSSSFITLCALEVATHLFVPVKPDRFALRGIQSLMRFIKSVPTISPTLAENTSFVLNHAAKNSDGKVITDLRGHPTFGPMVLNNEVRYSEFMAPQTDYNGFAIERKAPYKKDIQAVLAAVAGDFAHRLGFA